MIDLLEEVKRCIYHPQPAEEDNARKKLDHVIAALTPPADPSDRNTAAEHYRQGWQAGHAAADPPALVALVREWQQDVENLGSAGPEEDITDQYQKQVWESEARLLAYPLPAAPPVTDTPRGKCARWPACKWDSEGGQIHTCPICGPECSCGLIVLERPAVPPQEDQ